MIKFDDVLSIATQIQGESGFNLITIVYELKREMFFAVFRPHEEWDILIPITDTNTPLDDYLAYFEDEVQK